MPQIYFLLAVFFSHPSAHSAPPMLERRIWIEQKAKGIEDKQCEDNQKQWRCVFPQKPDCLAAMREAGAYCRANIVPDLPEYVDGVAGNAEAEKIVVQCLAVEFSKKHLIGMPKAKMDVYNECTGLTPRSKPLSAGFQKALDFSKTQTVFTCAESSFLRKCYGYSESECNALVSKAQTDCSMKAESDGPKVKDEPKAIQEAGKKITDCALAEARSTSVKSRKKSAHTDCE